MKSERESYMLGEYVKQAIEFLNASYKSESGVTFSRRDCCWREKSYGQLMNFLSQLDFVKVEKINDGHRIEFIKK